jgi:hypothetical protein
VLDRFMAALNAGDEPALLATLHFPHYRLAGGRMRVWDQPGAYLGAPVDGYFDFGRITLSSEKCGKGFVK